ncbi:helix-turn-helix transcriptional regulator [Solidesulfovibrio alcoholivorans]|uniref:helix-turn-helix transcriptional regulator n=1 Tax=Solidesulfovibrio alcoholivorans TaxID=81406 RepID=UPI0005C217B7|nr:helix-turn-helix transcriptional regulator [Solidesulfovibrio alcoholivorans]
MAFTTARIEIPSDSLPLVGQLVKKLGGKVFKDCGAEEVLFTAPVIEEKERVSRMLKGLRLRADLTQKGLAKQIGVPQSHISEYEKNKRKIPREKASDLARILKTVESDFIYKD